MTSTHNDVLPHYHMIIIIELREVLLVILIPPPPAARCDIAQTKNSAFAGRADHGDGPRRADSEDGASQRRAEAGVSGRIIKNPDTRTK